MDAGERKEWKREIDRKERGEGRVAKENQRENEIDPHSYRDRNETAIEQTDIQGIAERDRDWAKESLQGGAKAYSPGCMTEDRPESKRHRSL